ncbi:MAG: hydrogenase iron-sulfur subunit [Candidatus Bathyarchaeia archaeon]
MFSPRIIGFVCNWSLPQEMEAASPRMKGRPKMHVVKVMCAGRIDPVIVLETFAKGADGVLIIGCPQPDCHYVEGNNQTENRVKILKRLLALTGLEPDRLGLDWAYATSIEPFVRIVDEFRKQIMLLGVSPLAGKKQNKQVVLNVLAAKNAVSDFRLRVLAGREEELTEARNAYGETIPKGEMDELLGEVVKEEFIRHKIHLLTKQKPQSVKELAAATNQKPAHVLCHIVDMRRKGMIALDCIEETTPLYKALEVQ